MVAALTSARPVDRKGRYLHWDEVRRRTPPDSLTAEQWWAQMSFARRSIRKALPCADSNGEPFVFSNIDEIQEAVHRIDQQASGRILADEVMTSLTSSDRYLVSSLVEEAITSSQLEGASTTRRIAKQMLQTGRAPRDRSEQMIFNNFEAMQRAEELARRGADRPLEPADVLELQEILTRGTLDNPDDAGHLQAPEDERISVVWADGTILHRPPSAEELPARLDRLCAFANGDLDDGFIHPVVRAIVLHFWLAYDHPFADGNGRTARALFYWSMIRSGYWLTQYITISSILRGAPAQYARSFLYVETDDNDLTYFITYQLSVISRSIQSLEEYLSRKMAETRELQRHLRGATNLNHRQLTIVNDAIGEPDEPFTVKAQQRRHRVSYETARSDLRGLEALGLLFSSRDGKKLVYHAVRDLHEQLERLAQR